MREGERERGREKEGEEGKEKERVGEGGERGKCIASCFVHICPPLTAGPPPVLSLWKWRQNPFPGDGPLG